MTCSMDDQLGPYVLQALQPEEAEAIRQHLTGCPECREEAVSLASTASFLARLSPQDIEGLYDRDGAPANRAGPPASRPPGRSDGVPPDGARPVRRRRRVAVLALAAAMVAAVAGAGAIRVLGDRPGQPNPGVVQVADPATHVRAALAMTDRPWGTQLRLTLAGAYPGGRCSLVAHSRDGKSDTAASWVADTSGTAAIDGATAIPTSQLSELDVVTDRGELLVRITLPRRGD
jgi:Putative zinc-finger